MNPYPGHPPTDQQDPILAVCLSAARPLNGAKTLLFKCLCCHGVLSTCSDRENMEKQGETDVRRKDQGSPSSSPFDVRGRCYSSGSCTGRKQEKTNNKKTVKAHGKIMTLLFILDLFSLTEQNMV